MSSPRFPRIRHLISHISQGHAWWFKYERSALAKAARIFKQLWPGKAGRCHLLDGAAVEYSHLGFNGWRTLAIETEDESFG